MVNITLCSLLRNESGQASDYRPSINPFLTNLRLQQFWSSLAIYLLFLSTWSLGKLHSADKRLAVRSYMPPVVLCAGAIAELFLGAFADLNDPDQALPCTAGTFLIFLIIPALGLPLAFRLFAMYQASLVTAFALRTTSSSSSSVSTTFSPRAAAASAATNFTKNKKATSRIPRVTVRDVIESLTFRESSISARSLRVELLDDENEKDLAEDSSAEVPTLHNQHPVPPTSVQISARQIRAARFLASPKGTACMLAVTLLPYVVTSIAYTLTNPMAMEGCSGCSSSGTVGVVVVLGTVFALGLVVFSLWLCRNMPDPFLVVAEAKICAFSGFIALAFYITSKFVDLSNGAIFSWAIPFEAMLVVMCSLATFLPVLIVFAVRAPPFSQEFLSQGSCPFLCFHSVTDTLFHSSLHPWTEIFQNILTDEHSKAAFEAHLTAEHGVESLLFFEAAIVWRDVYYSVGAVTARVRAKRLVRLYIGDDAVFPINVSYEQSCRVLECVNRPVGDGPSDFNKHMLDEVIDEVVRLMYRDAFVRFMHSKVGLAACKDVVQRHNVGGGL